MLQHLWLSADRSRYFLPPADLELEDGADLIRSIRGEVRHVALENLLRFEISEEQAQAWARKKFSQVLQELRRACLNREAEASTSSSSSDSTPEASISCPTPGLDLLAELSQTPRQSLDGDLGAIGRALGAYFRDIGTTVADATSGDPARAARAQERMACWRAALGEAPDQEGGPGDAMPQRPADPEAADEPVAVEQATAWAEPLRRLAEQMRLRADAIAAARQAKDSR
jgi:hypothetical protein